jgi:class 3 adenylate cyclase
VSADPAAAAPSGVVTFLFTDVEGSTRRWESDADAMRAALVVHDKVLRTAIEASDGFVFSHTGDGFVAAFASPMSAVNAAIDAQRGCSCRCEWDWQPGRPSCETGTTSERCSIEPHE